MSADHVKVNIRYQASNTDPINPTCLPEWCTPSGTPEPASLCSSQPAPALQEEQSVDTNI